MGGSTRSLSLELLESSTTELLLGGSFLTLMSRVDGHRHPTIKCVDYDIYLEVLLLNVRSTRSWMSENRIFGTFIIFTRDFTSSDTVFHHWSYVTT